MSPWEDRFDEMTRKSEDVRRKMFIDAIREKNPAIDPDMVYLTPSEVLTAIDSDARITALRERIRAEYEPEEGKTALIFPDTERKPWVRGSTESLSFRNLYTSLKSLGIEEKIEVLALSPMIGPIPERFFDTMPMYESSGLASFMVKRRGLKWSQEEFRAVIERSAEITNQFMDRFRGSYLSVHAIYRVPSVHERIVNEMLDKNPLPIWKHTSKKSLSDSYLGVKKLVEEVRSSL